MPRTSPSRMTDIENTVETSARSNAADGASFNRCRDTSDRSRPTRIASSPTSSSSSDNRKSIWRRFGSQLPTPNQWHGHRSGHGRALCRDFGHCHLLFELCQASLSRTVDRNSRSGRALRWLIQIEQPPAQAIEIRVPVRRTCRLRALPGLVPQVIAPLHTMDY